MAQRTLVLPVVLVLACFRVFAYEDQVKDAERSVGGVLAGTAQCTKVGCFGALVLQPEMRIRLNGDHELFFKFGFAAGNGQNLKSPFNIVSWAADLQHDVEKINGSSRSHFLTAWYKHTANLGGSSTLESTFGLIDATDYLDDNAYSNDEYTQFMNSALVNGSNVFLPSYDAGVALNWTSHHWSVRGVYMNIEENDYGNSFHFVGVQLGYHADTPLGKGNYRLLVDATNDQFYDPTRTSLESRSAVLISCDQELSRTAGVFLRFGRQTDDAAIDYGNIYSGGIDLKGGVWGRERDNIGLGYAYLTDGNSELLRSQVVEGYYRFALNRIFSVTGDVQYMRDERRRGEGAEGFMVGLRLFAGF